MIGQTIVVARLYDERQVLQDVLKTKNFLTNLGEAYIADRLSDRDEGDGDISHMAIGIGSGQDRTSTALASQSAIVALTGGYPDQGTSGDDNDVLWRATFPAGTPAGDIIVSEGALFSAAAAGTMINYFEFSPGIPKASTESLQIDITWTIGAS